jgi:small subunit ribosomal protein S24e
MNVEILSSKENQLLSRKEVEATVSFDAATPKRAELKQAIGGKIAANPDFMVVRKVTSGFGSKSVKVIAYVYSSKESLMSIEPKHVKIREGFAQKEEKKKKAAPAAKKKKE